MPDSTLSVKFASFSDLQNLRNEFGGPSVDLPKDTLSVPPLNISRYFLYSVQLGSNNLFGTNDIQGHLNYAGGFITVGNKVNSKYSDFTVERTLTVNTSGQFYKGINLADKDNRRTNRVTNVRKLPEQPTTVDTFVSEQFDSRAITVGDFKRATYQKGMIMMWSGSWNTLTTKLPLWRLCAPPDSDLYPGVPDLLNRFVVAATYGAFEVRDNLSRPFKERVISLSPGASQTGGSDRITLEAFEMPKHKHNNTLTIAGGTFGLNPKNPTWPVLVTGGGALNGVNNTTHVAGPNFTPFRDISRNSFVDTTLGFDVTTSPFRWPNRNSPNDEWYSRLFSEDEIGSTSSHENRPPYYALAYIYYYGSPR